MRRPVAVSVLAAAALLIPVASAQAFHANVQAQDHTPTAGQPWPIKVSATSNSGKGVKATAVYQFVFQGKVERTCMPRPKGNPHNCYMRKNGYKPYGFKGHFRDKLIWPKRAVGIPLTLRVVVRHGHQKQKVNWPVVVKP